MQVFDKKWINKLEDQGVDIKLYFRYMDDGRSLLHPFHHGWRWSEDGRLQYSKSWAEEDGHLTPTEVTKRILLNSMRDVEPYLRFTVETGEDPEFGGWLPTLDTNVMVTNENIVRYKFYEKPTTTQITILKNSAMAENSKIQILANDLVRRLKNSSLELGKEQKVEVLDGYSQKLVNSGYATPQVRRIILSGVRGFENKVRTCREQNKRLHRTSQESSGARQRRKLLGKSNWFRGSRSKADSKTTPTWKSGKKSQQVGSKNNPVQELRTRSVLFVEQTPQGELARLLRELFIRLETTMGFRIKDHIIF